MTDDDAWGALAELVRLKDVKDALIPLVGAPDGFLSPEATILREDYDTHQPLAWARARDALDRHAMHLAEVEARRACPKCGHPRDGHDKLVGCLHGWSGDRTGPGCPCRESEATWLLGDVARRFQASLPGGDIVLLPPDHHAPAEAIDGIPMSKGDREVLVPLAPGEKPGVYTIEAGSWELPPTLAPQRHRVTWAQAAGGLPVRVPNPVGSQEVLVQAYDSDGYDVMPSMWITAEEIELAVRDADGELVPGEYVAQIYDAR